MNGERIPITEQVSWTLSMALIMQLSDLLRNSINLYLNGNIESAFFRLKAVRMRIIQNLRTKKLKGDEKSEREECLKFETDFAKQKLNKEDLIKDKAKYISTKQEQMRIYEEYNTFIMDLLEKYGYLIKKRDDTTNIVV